MNKKGKCYKFTFSYKEDEEVIKFLESIPQPLRGRFIAEVIKRVKADFINIASFAPDGNHNNNNLTTEEEREEPIESKEDKEKELPEPKKEEQSKENKQKPKLDFSKIFSL